MSMVEQQQYDPETGEIYAERASLAPSQPAPITELSVVSAEINQQIATARKYPRRKDKIIAQEIVERATLNQEIATECFYKLKRTSRGSDEAKDIMGPSIRFAEIVRASYGNIRVASRYVGIDERVRGRAVIVVEAVAMDMQNNDAVLMSVTRPIMTSPRNGQPRMFTADMVNVTMMAAQSIAQRDATLRLVPKALWIDGYHAAIDAARGDIATLTDRRKRMIEAFGKFGIKPAELYKAIGVDSADEIGLDQMVDLGGMWTSLKEGDPVDMVLGRAAEARITSEPITNPLADRATASNSSSGATDGATTAQAHLSSLSGSTVAEKSQPAAADQGEQIDMRRQARSEPAGAISGSAAVSQPAGDKDAQAASPRQEKGPSGERYLADALKFIAECRNATMLRDWRKRQGPAIEAAGLSLEQTDQLLAFYEERIGKLTGV